MIGFAKAKSLFTYRNGLVGHKSYNQLLYFQQLSTSETLIRIDTKPYWFQQRLKQGYVIP